MLLVALQQWREARERLQAGIDVLQTVFAPDDPGHGYVRRATALLERARAGELSTTS